MAESTDELVDTVRAVDDADEPLLLMSGGSNVVIGDGGFRGTAVRIASRGITVESLAACSGATVRVAAGAVSSTQPTLPPRDQGESSGAGGGFRAGGGADYVSPAPRDA